MDPLADEPQPYLIAHVREALAQDPRVNELDVQVSIVADRVLLSGAVSTAERQRCISEVVGELLPAYRVHNSTNVVTAPESAEMEELE